VSIPAAVAASAALGFLTGRLTRRPTIRRLTSQVKDLRSDTEMLERLLRSTWHKAHHDQLTGLPNRSLATILFRRRQLAGHPSTVTLVDLDRFKHINDSYGHHVGDDLLQVVAERLAVAANRHGGTAARLAGDEFLLLLPATDGDPGPLIAGILAGLATPTILHTDDGDITVHATASAGIALYDGGYGTFETLLHQADVALHHAKQHRNVHRIYQPGLGLPRNAGRHGPRLRDQHASHGTPACDGGTP
jgi:diguanylate cyclase (GGDEF)-like protein